MKLIWIFLLVACCAFAQNVPLASGPPGNVNTATAFVSGTPGPATLCYWIFASYPVGKVSPGSPACVANGPNTLSASNKVTITWSTLQGATGYDVLKTTSLSPPTTNCNCALVTNTQSNNVSDTGQGLSNYSIQTAGAASGSLGMNNRDFNSPQYQFVNPFVLNVPGIQFPDGTQLLTATGATLQKTGNTNIFASAVTPVTSGNCAQWDVNGNLVSTANPCGVGGGGGAPTTATYILQTANGTLTNAQALSGLSTGIVKVTTGTGVLSNAASADVLALCITCVTSAAVLTNNQLVGGAAGQGVKVVNLSGDVTTNNTLATTVVGIGGTLLTPLGTGLLKLTAGVPSIAVQADITAVCTTCVLAAAALTNLSIMAGNGGQNAQVSNITTDAGLNNLAVPGQITTGGAATGSWTINGSGGGALIVTAANTITNYTLTLPGAVAAASNSVLLSTNAGVGSWATITPTIIPGANLQGTTGTKFLVATGAFVSGNCIKSDANGNAVDNGALCSAAAPAFNTITSGTNTAATMTIGNGATLNNAAGGVVDLSAGTVTTALKLPQTAGAAPVATGFLAYDTTNKQLVYGDTNITVPAGKHIVNAQSGAGYTAVSGDLGKLVTVTNAGAQTLTIPQANSTTFPPGWYIDIENRGAGTWTITPTTSTIDGAANVALTTNQGVRVFSDGTNYFTMRGIGGNSSALSAITAASGSNTIANANNPQTWNWAQTSNSQSGMTFGETSAATSGTLGNQYEVKISTVLSSTAVALGLISSINGSQTLPTLHITPTWNTTGVVDAAILVNVTNTASGTASKLLDLQIGGTSEFNVDKTGLSTALIGIQTGTSPPTCTIGTAGTLCQGEGTAPTAASAVDQLYADSTAHTFRTQVNGGSPGLVNIILPGSIHQTGQTASIATATLCAAGAGACNQAGMYHVHVDFNNTGTACTNVTAGSVGFQLTWTDTNATVHSAIQLPLTTQASSTALAGTMVFVVNNLSAWGSGDMNISTNGSIIQYATNYTACTTGTGTYQVDAAVSRLQ